MEGTEIRTTQVAYDKAGKLDVICGRSLVARAAVYQK